MIYEFKKGELNKFNNLNQDLKTVFKKYMLFPNGYILGDPILRKGCHIGYTEFEMFFKHNNPLEFNSQAIFEAIKNNKKNIKFIKIDNNHIYFGGDDLLIEIGEVDTFHTSNKAYFESKALYKYKWLLRDNNIEKDNNFKVMKLSDDQVHLLVGNDYININKSKYKTRITKEIIPGLKKSSNVILILFDHDTDKHLFHLAINTNRSSCTTCHIYTCLYM